MPPISMSSAVPNLPSAPRSRLVISLPVATGSPSASSSIGAQEHLVRGMRGVGLVLVDERRRGVLVLVDVVGGAEDAVRTGQMVARVTHHEVGRAEPGDIERIVRLAAE